MLLYGLQTETEKPEIPMTKQSTLSVWKILILDVKSQRGDIDLCQCTRVDPKLMSQMKLNCTLNNFLHRLCLIDSVWII